MIFLSILAERKERIAFAKAALDNPTVSPAEGLRQVLEAFNVEAEYGRKLDAYKDSIVIDGELREGNILEWEDWQWFSRRLMRLKLTHGITTQDLGLSLIIAIETLLEEV